MATITEKKKEGKVVAFKFFRSIGRDEKGKQHFCTTTWKPPQNLTYYALSAIPSGRVPFPGWTHVIREKR